MNFGALGLEGPVQIAYAVVDAAEAAREFSARHGAGPFFLNQHIAVTDVVYRGRPGVFDHTSAYGQWGDVMVELVQDHGDGPSAVRELYAVGETGLHHLAFFVDDFDDAVGRLEADGFPQAMVATAGETRFAFHDATTTLGHMVEIYVGSDRLRGFYAMVRDAARGWDGTDPVRIVHPVR